MHGWVSAESVLRLKQATTKIAVAATLHVGVEVHVPVASDSTLQAPAFQSCHGSPDVYQQVTGSAILTSSSHLLLDVFCGKVCVCSWTHPLQPQRSGTAENMIDLLGSGQA